MGCPGMALTARTTGKLTEEPALAIADVTQYPEWVRQYALFALICVASIILTGWGLQARLLGPATPEPSLSILAEVPSPVPADAFHLMNGKPLEGAALEGIWTVICADQKTCSVENGLPAEALAGILNDLRQGLPASTRFQVLDVVPAGAYSAPLKIGDVSVIPVSAVNGYSPSGIARAAVQIVDPYGRQYASIDLASPTAFRSAMHEVMDFLNKEVMARML